WRRQHSGYHQLVIKPKRQLVLIIEVHDKLGHKGFYSTCQTLLDWFWWPGLERNLVWFIKTCHECQLCNTAHIFIPPIPAPPFRKAYFDMVFMPAAQGFKILMQVRCSLTGYPEWVKL
ncbi:hypothetical protein K439DRAFT_857057, partial [Ramaria rubella]